MSARLIFELPLPENLANSRAHWATKDRARRDYWRVLDLHVMAKRLPRPPAVPWPRARVAATLRTVRQMDADNAAARCKWPLDWLQSRGYIVNDRDITLTVAAETAARDACGITLALEPAPRA